MMRAGLLALTLLRSLHAFSFSATLDARTAHHAYAGHGALSAGASSRLLWDYPEPQRSQILDYLFKPQFGAGLAILKVEIGGDAQSTDGTEPSHMHFRNDLSCTRGYELFLIEEAKKRNPSILAYGLSWGAPAWVGNQTYYSAENVEYQTAWVNCIWEQAGTKLDFLGLWNEKPQPSADYLLSLRASLDAAGFSSTKLIVMDGGFDGNELALAQSNASYRQAVYGAGLHYPCNQPHPEVERVGWDFWASEDYSRDPAWENGGTYWGKVLSENYILMNMTATISWSLIWSAYTNLVCNGAGLMRAHTPWSANYEVSAPIWMSAHWTQFVSPGWRFLTVNGGGSGFIADPAAPPGSKPSGTYVTLAPPDSSTHIAIIAETLVNDACVARSNAPVNATFLLTGGFPLAGTVLQAWRTTRDSFFTRLQDVVVGPGGTFTALLPIDSITTFSNVPGATHGSFPTSPIPAAQPWALPYADDFSTYPEDAMARFFSDQGGSWAVRGGRLVMVAQGDPGGNAWAPNPDPLTQIGDESWVDYFIEATVQFNTTGPYPPPPSVPSAAAPRPTAQGLPRERERVWRAAQGLPERPPAAAPSAFSLQPCDATDPAQSFQFDSAPGYLRNEKSGNCLNVNGCGTLVDLYQCVSGPSGSSCGAPAGSYPNLQWTYSPGSGALASGMAGSPLLTIFPANASTFALPAGAAGGIQAWDFNATSGSLSPRSLAPTQCLSTPPTQHYAKVCIRVATFDGFTAAPITAICLQVFAKGTWQLVGPGGDILGAGALPPPFSPSDPHTLRLGGSGDSVEGWVDGVSVVQVGGVSTAAGNAAIGTGWHASRWSNFSLGAL